MSATATQLALEQNKALVRRWFEEVWNKGRLEVAEEILTADGEIHDGVNSYRGPKEFAIFYQRLHEQFSKFSIQPVVELAEGDLVCMHWSAEFRHTASDKPLKVAGTSVVRIADGQVVEGWQNWDAAGLGEQLKSYGLA